jgi:hypothetical protein
VQSRWLPRLVFGLLLAYLLLAVPAGLRNTVLRLRMAARTAGLPVPALRARAFGPDYTAAVDEIRRTIPVGEPYLLSYQDDLGAMLWVRYDLLPRRAIVPRPPGSPFAGANDCWPDQVRWLIVGVGGGRAPLFVERPVRVPPGCPPAPWRKLQP